MKRDYTTLEKAKAYDKSADIIFALLKEMRELSKKKPEGVLSKFQVRTINRALKDAQIVFQDDEKLDYLDLLEEDDLPKNVDAVFVMAQYESALRGFRERYFGWDGLASEHAWSIRGEKE